MAEFKVNPDPVAEEPQSQSQPGPSFPSGDAQPAVQESKPAEEGYFAVVPVADADAENSEAAKVAAEDAQARVDNPNAAVVREANPAVGGESF